MPSVFTEPPGGAPPIDAWEARVAAERAYREALARVWEVVKG